MRRLMPLVLAALVVMACDDQVGPPADLGPYPASPAIVDADHGGGLNPFARWLDPIVLDVQTANFGTFDGTVTSARFHVVCIQSDLTSPVAGPDGCSALQADWSDPFNDFVVDLYQVSDATLLIQEDHYHAQVEMGHLTKSDGTTETTYRLVATVEPSTGAQPVVVAYADFLALTNGRAKSAFNPDTITLHVGSQLPAKLRLDQGVLGYATGQDAFGSGTFTQAVLQPGVEQTVEFQQDGATTARFFFDGTEVSEPVSFFLGVPKDEAGNDVCGDLFSFEKAGCHRALAFSLVDPQPAPSAVTSGYIFNEGQDGGAQFCIATGLSATDPRPWQLVKIDDYGEGPEFEILPQTNEVCADLSSPSPELALAQEPVKWLQHNVGKRVLDFLMPPLFAGHSTDVMGSTVRDLSDLTAALLREMQLDAPSSMVVGSAYPVTATVVNTGFGDHHSAEPAVGVDVSFSVTTGSLADAFGAPITFPISTGSDGSVTVYWTISSSATGTESITATADETVTTNGTITSPVTVVTSDVLFSASFEDETVGSAPTAPEVGTWSVIENDVTVQSGLGDVSSNLAVLTHPGGLAISPNLIGTMSGTPPSSGTWVASWTYVVDSNPGSSLGDVFGPVVIRGSGGIIASVEFRGDANADGNGEITLNSFDNDVGDWSQLVGQTFQLIIDLDAQTTSLSIDGQTVAAAVPFVNAVTSLSQIGVEVGLTTAQKFGWDDIVIAPLAASPQVTIDGFLSPGEWADATVFGPVAVNLPGGGTTTATAYVTNDATDLLVAVQFDQDMSVFFTHTIAVRLDKPVNNAWDCDDDGFTVQHKNALGERVDEFFDSFFHCDLGQGQTDVEWGGTNDGVTAIVNSASSTVIEASHPLNTPDIRDTPMSAGEAFGLLLFTFVKDAAGAQSFTDLVPAWAALTVQ